MVNASLDELEKQIEQAKGRIARAEYEQETALEAKQEALDSLKSLGVATVDEARVLLDRLKEELSTEVRQVQADLAVAE